jgi:hypothetical protein
MTIFYGYLKGSGEPLGYSGLNAIKSIFFTDFGEMT